MTETKFNWALAKTISMELHVYDKENNYIAFDHEEEMIYFKFLRKILPPWFGGS